MSCPYSRLPYELKTLILSYCVFPPPELCMKRLTDCRRFWPRMFLLDSHELRCPAPVYASRQHLYSVEDVKNMYNHLDNALFFGYGGTAHFSSYMDYENLQLTTDILLAACDTFSPDAWHYCVHFMTTWDKIKKWMLLLLRSLNFAYDAYDEIWDGIISTRIQRNAQELYKIMKECDQYAIISRYIKRSKTKRSRE